MAGVMLLTTITCCQLISNFLPWPSDQFMTSSNPDQWNMSSGHCKKKTRPCRNFIPKLWIKVHKFLFFWTIFHEINSHYFKIFHSYDKRVNVDMQTYLPRREGWLRLKVKRRKLPKHQVHLFFLAMNNLKLWFCTFRFCYYFYASKQHF